MLLSSAAAVVILFGVFPQELHSVCLCRRNLTLAFCFTRFAFALIILASLPASILARIALTFATFIRRRFVLVGLFFVLVGLLSPLRRLVGTRSSMLRCCIGILLHLFQL